MNERLPSLLDVIRRYPDLQAGLPAHADEVVRIAGRIIALEANPPRPPELPADAPGWERAYWHRRDSSQKASK